MEKNKNKETKDLTLNQEKKDIKDIKETKKEVKKDKKGDDKKGSNSFYEETSTVSNISWYKDWRGKALILGLIGVLFIGGGIPLGMEISGFWKKFKGDDLPYNPSEHEKILNEIKIKTNTAYIDNLDVMTDEGWFTESQKGLIVKNAKKDADKQVKDEKKAVKSQYGKVWEDAWNKQLQEKGFDTEQQYNDSIVSAKYKTKEISQYTNSSNIVKRVHEDPGADVKYKSVEGKVKHQWKYINNTTPITPPAPENDDPAPEPTRKLTLTSEKLVTLFLHMYQPILFNDSLLEFTPSKGQGGEADIAATTISITNDQILNALDMHYNLTDEGETYEQFSNNYGDVMSLPNLSFEDVATSVSLNAEVAGLSHSDSLDLDGIITNAFDEAVGKSGTIDSLTKDDIDAFTSDQDELFATSLRDSLVAANVIGTSTERKFYTTWEKDSKTYTSFVSTDGLHSVGIQHQDQKLIEDFLNIENKSSDDVEGNDWTKLAESNINSKYTEWISSNFDNIILATWLINTNMDDWGIDDSAEFGEVWISDFLSSTLLKIIEKKNEAKTYYTDNFEYYDLSSFNENAFLVALMKESNILKVLVGQTGIFNLNNEIIKYGGYSE